MEIRRAEISDAARLLDIRHDAIIELAVPALTTEQAQAWATKHDLSWMDEMIRTKPLWVACTPEAVVAWAGLDGDQLIALYTDPAFTQRGIATALLTRAEEHLSRSGAAAIRLEASWNAEQFYNNRGYRPLAERPPDGPRPMMKPLR